MAFFQDLGKKITNVAQDASKKTTEMIEISKLNSSINAEKTAIAETHKKIGVTIYSLYTAGETLPEAVVADVQSIASRLQSITTLENKIAEVKAESESARAEAAAATPGAAAPAAGTRFCSGCGAALEAGMVFCGKCGHKND